MVKVVSFSSNPSPPSSLVITLKTSIANWSPKPDSIIEKYLASSISFILVLDIR